MKKSFLSAIGLFVAGAAMAIPAGPARLTILPGAGFNTMDVESFSEYVSPQSRADGKTLDYTPAFDPFQAVSFNGVAAGTTMAMALEISPSDVTLLNGDKIIAVNFYTGANKSSGKNQIKTYTVFLSNNLNKDPFYTQEVEVPSTDPFVRYNVELDQPYELKSGTPVFVGVMCKLTAADDVPVVVDGMMHYDNCGCWIGANSGSGSLQWVNYASQLGFACVGATISGAINLPDNSLSVNDWSVTSAVRAGEEFDLKVLVTSNGAAAVNSMELTYGFEGMAQTSEVFDLEQTVGYKRYCVLAIPKLTYPDPTGGVKLNFAVTKVNGVVNEDAAKAAYEEIIVLPADGGYTRCALVEEFTGTWCGYCPTGISTMERIREEYTAKDGSIIPIAVHVNGGGSDPMTTAAFSKVAALNSEGVPNAIINRMVLTSPQDYSSFIKACRSVMDLPAVGKIELEATPGENAVELKAVTEFALDFKDADERYIVAFAITENNVGPYKQTNYYAGEAGDYCGWENKPSSVSMMYNDVARQLSTFSGLSGSVPAVVKAGEPCEFSYTINYSNKIDDVENLNYIAYLLDRKTGAVENAAIVTAKEYVGVDEVEAVTSVDAPVEYYNLQGIRVENPSGGLYIRRQGSTATKVLLK